jgi:hypothetical protein
MTYPPHDDRLRHLIAQEINPHVASWKLAFFIADGIVTSREVRGELKRIAEAHAAAEHCGDRNCEHCWTVSVTTADPAAAPSAPAGEALPPVDRLAILREEAVKLIGDCPDHSLNGGALQSCQCEAAGVLLGATPAAVARQADTAGEQQ